VSAAILAEHPDMQARGYFVQETEYEGRPDWCWGIDGKILGDTCLTPEDATAAAVDYYAEQHPTPVEPDDAEYAVLRRYGYDAWAAL
jgi:hypothetical protein